MNIKQLIIEELRRLGAYSPEQLFKSIENDFYVDDEGEVLINFDGDIGTFEEVVARMKLDVEHFGHQFVAPDPEWEAHKAGIAMRCSRDDFVHLIKQV